MTRRSFYDLWPFVSLVLALAGGALLFAFRDQYADHELWFILVFLHLICQMLHQFEEYGWPGGFVDWFNSVVFGSTEREFPLSKKMACVFNFGLLYWVFAGLGVVGATAIPWIGLAAVCTNMAN